MSTPRPRVRLAALLPCLLLTLSGLIASPPELPAEVRLVAEAPIAFSARAQKLPVPLVSARIAGREGLLVLDTGSSHQALTRTFADAQGLASTPSGEGRDHAGAKVATQRAAPCEWVIGSFGRRIEEAVIVPAPAPFGPLGIVGFLSPQNFFPDATVVLDFPSGRLLALAGDSAAIRAWLAARYPAAPSTELARAPGPHAEKLYVTVAVTGQREALAEIDTGGSMTEFAEALLPAGPTTQTTTSVAVSGSTRTARTVEGQTLDLGALSFSGLKVKTRPPSGQPAVLIGTDVLRRTVLVIPADKRAPLLLLRP